MMLEQPGPSVVLLKPVLFAIRISDISSTEENNLLNFKDNYRNLFLRVIKMDHVLCLSG